ncbi:hypothetical protein MNBD_NITROSPINAE04-1696 [hydrothermal vent metagenome]|uniref:Uncharacterized protein n=1 Tax=hydrothermal vent metagenome TaxID=652676 RepID=A0A3B1D5H3_9ZZZZ
MNTNTDIISKPWIVFVVAPLAIFIFPHVFLVTGGYEAWIMPDPREDGYVENASALFFLLAGIYAFYLAKSNIGGQTIFFRAAMVFFGLTAVWVCLEEISYGQHFIGYSTPDWFLAHNKNREFNFHNLDKDAPSYALKTAGYVLVSTVGIVAPLIARSMKIGYAISGVSILGLPIPGFFRYFIPTCWMIPPSLLHLFANLPKNIIKLLPGGQELVESSHYFSESGEYEEYMLGVWVFLYVVSIHAAIRKHSAISKERKL